MYSGFPITIGSSNASASNNGGGARANQYHKLTVTGRSVANWFGTGPDALPCTGTAGATINANGVACAYGPEAANSFGTARVGTERAPGYRVVDTSLFKQFRTFREQFVQLRIDAFNVGNIASYAAPGSTASTPSTFGLITSTLSPARQLQYSLKYGF